MAQVKVPRSRDTEIKQNYEAFKKLLPGLLETHRGKCALMRDGELVAIYTTVQDAVQTGESFYDDKLFSVQTITDGVVDLGFLSRALHSG